MSTYINVANPDHHAPYLDIPDDVVDYLHYLDFVKRRSPRTINGYYIDLRGFFRFMMVDWNLAKYDTPPEQLPLSEIDRSQIAKIRKRDIFSYLEYTRANGSGERARARKLSALRGFFNYLCTQVERPLAQNPTENISLGAPKKTLPKYLTLEESISLLQNIQSDFYERDYCILTLFLNCGMRLAELVTIDLYDFRDDSIRITGKGSKERLVYLNNACLSALEPYLKARAALAHLVDKEALFVSKRTGKRLTARRVEQIVERCLKSAGLDGRGYSPHKLRHTAATLMYQHGNVDMLALKEILGHENVSTTQIYTHINQRQLREAVASSPLSQINYAPPVAEQEAREPDDDRASKPAATQNVRGKSDRLDAKPAVERRYRSRRPVSEQDVRKEDGGSGAKPAAKRRYRHRK